MSTTPTWCESSLPVIEATVRALPADATREQVRKALRAAYPFGSREHHPYKVWCGCVREYLDKRFGSLNSGGKDLFIISNSGLVFCASCDSRKLKLAGGCLLCCGLRERWAALWAEPARDVLEVFRLARECADDAAMLADFLDDHGWEELSAQVRLLHAPKKRTRQRKETV